MSASTIQPNQFSYAFTRNNTFSLKIVQQIRANKNENSPSNTAQKMKFSIKSFFSKCDQIRRELRIWSHLLKKCLIENFIFSAVKKGHVTQWVWLLYCIRSSRQQMFFKIGILKIFEKFRKHLQQSLFFNKVAGLHSSNLIEKRLWHRCFAMNFPKILRIPFLQNTCRGFFCCM